MNTRTVAQRTNRERYIIKKNEHDLMMTICDNANDLCPMQVIGAAQPKCIPDKKYDFRVNCAECIQRWLNEESEG